MLRWGRRPRAPASISRGRRSVTLNGSAYVRKICSTLFSRCSMILPTAPPMPGRSASNGRASRCPAGPTVTPQTRRRPSPNRRPAAAQSPNCSTPTRPSPASLQAHYARKSSLSPCPPRPMAANMIGDDFALTAGWGHYGSGGVVMPGQGRLEERPFTVAEHGGLRRDDACVAPTQPDHIRHLPERACLLAQRAGGGVALQTRRLPSPAATKSCGYQVLRLPSPAATKSCGYQVLKKWLSYRERSILARPLTPEEVRHFTDTARRIAAILTLTDT